MNKKILREIKADIIIELQFNTYKKPCDGVHHFRGFQLASGHGLHHFRGFQLASG